MSELRELFDKGKWYHCFRYQGMVSNGMYDVERTVQHYHFDRDYRGKTVLDVGCSDGYFSIWMKEHGADRVLAVDSNKYDSSLAIEPSRFNASAFEQKYAQYVEDYTRYRAVYEQYGLANSNKLLLMAKLKGVDVSFETGTIYDLAPYGEFDVVMCNALLEHLRNPITAIEQLRGATRHKCIIAVSSAMKTTWCNRNKPVLTYQGHVSGGSFYSLSEASVLAMCKAAGFRDARVVGRFEIPNRVHGDLNRHFVVHATR